jgi:hypothetical protein
MLYFFNESCLRRVSVIRIHHVLSTQNIVDVVAPFLKGWQDFEECGFNVCNVLMRISREFRSQLHLDDTFLSSAIIERYCAELEDFLVLYHLYQGQIFSQAINESIQTNYTSCQRLKTSIESGYFHIYRTRLKESLKSLWGTLEKLKFSSSLNPVKTKRDRGKDEGNSGNKTRINDLGRLIQY